MICCPHCKAEVAFTCEEPPANCPECGRSLGSEPAREFLPSRAVPPMPTWMESVKLRRHSFARAISGLAFCFGVLVVLGGFASMAEGGPPALAIGAAVMSLGVIVLLLSVILSVMIGDEGEQSG